MTALATNRRIRRLALAAVLALGLVAAGCGDDDDSESAEETRDTDETSTTEETAAQEPTAMPVTLTESAVQGLPDEVPAGLVDVTVTDETEGAGGEVNFARVEQGTTEEEFPAALEPVFEGGPFPDFFLNNAGAIERSTLALDAGSYIVWFDRASNLERESTQEDIVTASLEVTEGEDGAELPEADGSVTGTDYDFEVDVAAGPAQVNFLNESEEQFHHVVLVDFGTNDRQVVEDNLPAILESEDPSSLPEGIDGEQIDFEFGSSGVFGPGSAGTFEADFEEGTTYAALCFIQDRAGSAPHAVQHDMYEVFQVPAS